MSYNLQALCPLLLFTPLPTLLIPLIITIQAIRGKGKTIKKAIKVGTKEPNTMATTKKHSKTQPTCGYREGILHSTSCARRDLLLRKIFWVSNSKNREFTLKVFVLAIF
ncbi:hypothetical protein RND81_06G131300 [Saponaria officinalis]|uniref:Uncharacterized protein n=1 Tax=Saponaria officinalis TaxID=3572 RepID=A0AAW1KAU4_SAPOF